MAYKLTINFTPANPDSGNYRIKIWPPNNPMNVTTSYTIASPLVLNGLSECAYNGTVENACEGNIFSTPQPFSISICPNEPVSYTPCALISSNNLAPSDIYLAPGVTDIATGVTLYDANGNVITTVTQIADSNGLIYNVGSDGVVTTSTTNMC